MELDDESGVGCSKSFIQWLLHFMVGKGNHHVLNLSRLPSGPPYPVESDRAVLVSNLTRQLEFDTMYSDHVEQLRRWYSLPLEGAF